jgi:alpha-L-fucosidase
MVFVTKHHDGFCMFDSKYTNYKITSENCPYKKDVLLNLANAAHAKNMRLGVYYSKPDWFNPYVNTSQHSKYVEYVHHQVEELSQNYGNIDLFYFDGGNPAEFVNSDSIYRILQRYQPNTVINNRLWNDGRGDYLTPEGTLYKFNRYQLWECCNGIGRAWSWRPDDPYERSAEAILTELRTVVGSDGNYLLGIGPMPNGQVAQRHIDKLKYIGAWLKKFGESIYGTRGGPYMPINQDLVSTCKHNKIYIHILNWDAFTNQINLKKLPASISKVYFMGADNLKFSNDNNGFKINVPSELKNANNTVIVVETDITAFKIRPL